MAGSSPVSHQSVCDCLRALAQSCDDRASAIETDTSQPVCQSAAHASHHHPTPVCAQGEEEGDEGEEVEPAKPYAALVVSGLMCVRLRSYAAQHVASCVRHSLSDALQAGL